MSEEKFKPKVTIKKVHLVANWMYNIENDACAICHVQLTVPCISCEAESYSRNEQCTVSWGNCGHSFHFHCISRWLTTRSSCPLDDSEWEYSKI